jgi:hypothetical protein
MSLSLPLPLVQPSQGRVSESIRMQSGERREILLSGIDPVALTLTLVLPLALLLSSSSGFRSALA